MLIANSITEVKENIKNVKAQMKTIGFVPTMGYFHDGHLSLMKAAKAHTDYVVVSIFVNPTQFGPNEDFESYPRDIERDLKRCNTEGVDLVFIPTVSEMYPDGYSTYVTTEGNITNVLCGASRPGHFKGVTSVVSKLFNIVEPNIAFFGQKDAQQVAVIEKMVRDLNINISIMPCPIVRETDGLAMSSRNVYLTENQRKQALVLSKSLTEAADAVDSGVRDAVQIIALIKNAIEKADEATIDYIQILDAKELTSLSVLKNEVLIALAVKFGKTRLIDNLRMTIK